jgi:hypothetical protein
MVYPVDKLDDHQKAIYDILENKKETILWTAL